MKKTVKKACICLIAIGMLAATLVSCATAKNAVPEKAKAVLVKEDSRMLWSINGTDRNGNPSKIYVQGTFHIADGRCYPVSDLVEEAFFSADRIFGEISGEGNIELNIRMPSIYEESMARANGRLLSDNLSDEDVLLLIQLAGEDVFNTLNQFEPWVLTTVLSTSIYMISGFSPDYGLDAVFNNAAIGCGIQVEGLDTVDCQLEALSFGTYDQQMIVLQNTIDGFKDFEKTNREAQEFYQAYLDDDVARIAEIGFGELEDATLSAEEQAYNEEYEKVLIFDRNEKWAGIFEDLLEEGGTTFVYAGTLHFVGDHSVFKYMEENGTLVIE